MPSSSMLVSNSRGNLHERERERERFYYSKLDEFMRVHEADEMDTILKITHTRMQASFVQSCIHGRSII